MTEIANPHWTPSTLQSHTVMANCPGVQPHAPHSFHIHLHATPHVVCQNPCDTTPPMLPCGECMTLLSDFKTYMPCHAEASHPWPPKPFEAPSHCPHFGPCIHHVKFVVALQPQFHFFYTSLLALLWIPDRPVSLLCDSSLTLMVVVVSSVFQLFSFLDRSSLIPTMPTKFHHHLQAWIHSMPITPGLRPLHFSLEVLHIMVFTQNSHSSFVRIAVG